MQIIDGVLNLMYPTWTTAVICKLFRTVSYDRPQCVPKRIHEEDCNSGRRRKNRGKAFLNCFALEEVVIPNTLKYIGDLAFASCTKLREINLPDY